jgi:peptidoglycan/xylan/chitin deacetylase (PgdA/CDA1 family)
LEALRFSGAARLTQGWAGSLGAILGVEHVRPPQPGKFQPNRDQEITPEFLERLIHGLQQSGYNIISFDELPRRLVVPENKRFVAFALVGGYRDQAEYAWPLFKKLGAPFTLFVTTSFADRNGLLWWRVIETIIAEQDQIAILADGREQRLDCRNSGEKQALYQDLVRWLRARETDAEIQSFVRDLARRYEADPVKVCAQYCLSWSEIGEMAKDPLVSIGSHSVNYPVLSKLPDQKVISEMTMSRAVIENAVGTRPRHFCYPFGDSDAAGPREFRFADDVGYTTGLTARFGVLYPAHRDHLHALPRISLHGALQRRRYVQTMTSGAPSLLLNGFRKVDVG